MSLGNAAVWRYNRQGNAAGSHLSWFSLRRRLDFSDPRESGAEVAVHHDLVSDPRGDHGPQLFFQTNSGALQSHRP